MSTYLYGLDDTHPLGYNTLASPPLTSIGPSLLS